MEQPIIFDLTEVQLASTGKLRFYGIVRCVHEIALHIARIDPAVRFCVFSAGHQSFFEVPVRRDRDAVAFDVPLGVRQLRLRSVFPDRRPLRDAVAATARAVVGGLNRRAWDRAGIDLPKIDLNGATYVSCARPKLIVDQIAALDRASTRIDLVPLIHDMIPLHDHFEHRSKSFPTNFVADNIRILNRAARVMTNSEFTRSELLRFSASGYLPAISANYIHPVPLVHECSDADPSPRISPPAEPYLLTVGSLLGRKNLEAVLDAMEVLRSRGVAVPLLVIAGARRKRVEEHIGSEERKGVRDRVVFRHTPPQADLIALYRGAVATVVPSRMEGWGLPAGESLWLGTPAICADVPALHEVAGDLGLYFDPDDAAALANHVARLMEDSEHVRVLRERIRGARPRLRTWSDVARDVLAILPSAAGGTRRHAEDCRAERGSRASARCLPSATDAQGDAVGIGRG
ncbi:glycosyltransferase family 4 protein [Hasllibacter halocynthiae]|nr:glycosyltransferase family 1 protein [Hasllibacter halocynthiae]